MIETAHVIQGIVVLEIRMVPKTHPILRCCCSIESDIYPAISSAFSISIADAIAPTVRSMSFEV